MVLSSKTILWEIDSLRDSKIIATNISIYINTDMKTDFITIKFPYQISNNQTQYFELLADMRRQQSAMYRSAYSAASVGVALNQE